MDHRKHAARSRERMKGYASGGAVTEPLVDERGRMSSEMPPDADWKRLYQPSSPYAAADARETAASRVRNSTKREK